MLQTTTNITHTQQKSSQSTVTLTDRNFPPDGTALVKSNKTATTFTTFFYEHGVEIVADGPVKRPSPRFRGKRNRIERFTRTSRRALWKLLTRFRYSLMKSGSFVTLTYHNNYPEEPSEYKTHLHRFLDDVKRVYPEILYIWKLEFQKRGAPHFHIMFFFPKHSENEFDSYFNLIINKIWSKYRGCQCIHCAAHSVLIEPILSYKKTCRYVSKYIAKEDAPPPLDYPGRYYGRSSNFPLQPLSTIRITTQEYFRVKTVVKRILKSRRNKSANYADRLDDNLSVWIMLNDDELNELKHQLFKIMNCPWEYIPILC